MPGVTVRRRSNFGAYVETRLAVTHGETTVQSGLRRVGQAVASITVLLALVGGVYWATALKFTRTEC